MAKSCQSPITFKEKKKETDPREYPLTSDDLPDLIKDLETIAVYYKRLGVGLKLRDHTVQEIEDRHDGKHWKGLYDVLSEWLRWNYDHERHGTPNRAWIVEAVESINPQLAHTLKEKYFPDN